MPPPDRPSRSLVFLLGFMGSGKTTVGRALAALMGWRFVDLDGLIEAREGRSIREIFETRGEAEFRRLEHDAIAECRELSDTVVALGGGAFIADANRALISALGLSVWIDCPLDVCLDRLGDDPRRPLLRGREEMRELFDRRRPFYQLADFTVQTGDRPPEEYAAEITARLFA